MAERIPLKNLVVVIEAIRDERARRSQVLSHMRQQWPDLADEIRTELEPAVARCKTCKHWKPCRRLAMRYEDGSVLMEDGHERLAERGGLAPEEMWIAAHGKRVVRDHVDEQVAIDWLYAERVKYIDKEMKQ